MNCEEVDRLISDYSVRNLSQRVEEKVREHLAGCASCARELERLDLIMAAVEQEMIEIEPPQGLWNGIHNRLFVEPRRRSWFGGLTLRPSKMFAVGATAALATILAVGLVPKSNVKVVPTPNAAVMGYVRDHATAASSGAFADRVSLGFVASISTDGGRKEL